MPTIKTIGIKQELLNIMLNRKEEAPRQFKVMGSLRWEMTDHYGYPVELSQIRNERIDGLLSSQSDVHQEDIRYSLSLRKIDEDGWGHYNIDWYQGKLTLYSTVYDDSQPHLRIKLNSDSFERSEELVGLLIQGNNLELMPVSRADFKNNR